MHNCIGMHSCNIWISFDVLAIFGYFFMFLQYSIITRRHALLQYLVIFLCLCNIGIFFDVLAIFYHQKACTLAIFGFFWCSLKDNQLHRYAVHSSNNAIFFMFLHYFLSSRCTIALKCSALLQYLDIFLCSCNILSTEDPQLHRHDLEYFDFLVIFR